MSQGDLLAENASSFFIECQEMSHIARNVTNKSLVLVDEFGRSTSTIDGVAIAWAMSERLLAAQCFVLFATHYTELTELPQVYPEAENFQLRVRTLVVFSNSTVVLDLKISLPIGASRR